MNIVDFLINPQVHLSPTLSSLFSILRIVFIFLSLFMITAMIYFIYKSDYFGKRYLDDLAEFTKSEARGGVKITQDWKEIEKKKESEDESERKISIAEADDMLERVLVRLGYEGDSLEEKLKKLDDDALSNMDDVIKAHRRRRDMSHDTSYRLTKEETEEIIQIYKEVFDNLQVF